MRFAFTSFLKLASQSRKQQRTVIRKRILGGGGGYDFHKRLKGYCRRRVLGESLESLLLEVAGIGYERERLSIIHGLKQLEHWLLANPGKPFIVPPKIYLSPRGLIQVDLAPEFGLENGGHRKAFQVWKTKAPPINPDARTGCLRMLGAEYQDSATIGVEFELLSLLVPRAYGVQPSLRPELGDPVSLTRYFEHLIEDVRKELRLPPLPPGPHPPPPGPP